MSNASAATYPLLSDAERKEREAMLRQFGLDRPKPATVIPLGATRKPLGLRPVDGDDDRAPERDVAPYGEPDLDRGPIIDLAEYSQEFRDGSATVGMLYFSLNTAASLTETLGERTKARFAELRAEIAGLEVANANLRATLAEVRAKVAELTFVSERLRVEARRPGGERGPMGRDGHDGPQGLRGERGPRGEAGAPAPVVAAWEPHAEQFTITPVYSDGTRGVPLNLLGLFQAYNAATEWDDDRDIVEAARASREANEAETERARAHLR